MKVLMINGSADREGCTYTALCEVAQALKEDNVESEIIQIGNKVIRDCTGCCSCRKRNGLCVYREDIVNEIIEKAKKADGFVFGSPVYYAHPSGRILSLLDRVFFAGKKNFEFKPGAAIVSARRAGTTASLDVINKYFTINQMPIVSSNYWNMVHGNTPDEVLKDKEGMQIMRTLGHNMAWLLKCVEAGRMIGIMRTAEEEKIWTNFVR